MKTRPIVMLASAMLLALAGPSRAEDYNNNCDPPTAEERNTMDAMSELNIRLTAFDKLKMSICQKKHAFLRLIKLEPDPDKITNDTILEAAKPDIDPVLARRQAGIERNAAAERIKMRAERAEYERRNSNPAEEAAREHSAEMERNRVYEPVPLTPAAAGERPPAPEPVVLPPERKGGFIRVFEGKQDTTSGTDTLNGKGTMISDEGIQAGTFKGNELQGEGEEITPDGTWRGGKFDKGEIEGPGFEVREVGQKLEFVEANFKDDKPEGIVEVSYDDGTSRHDLWQDGERIAQGQLAAAGKAPVDPVYKSPAALAAEADADFDRKLQSLPSASALFAMADEVAEKGDTAKARRAYRALMTRFPDSRLAALSGERLSNVDQRGGAASPQPAVSASAQYSSVCTRDAAKISNFITSHPASPLTPAFSNVAVRMWARCQAYDPVAAQNARDKQDEYAEAVRRGYQNGGGNDLVVAEVERAIANPNYSAELGPVRMSGNGNGGSAARSSAPAGAGVCSGTNGLAQFDAEFGQFQQQYPLPGGGTRNTYQYLMFGMATGMKMLRKYQSCLDPNIYQQNMQAMQAQYDRGLEGCRNTSSDGGQNCVAEYPRP